jgi:hypothetical protein
MSLPFGFLTFDSSFYILGTLVVSKSFIEAFVTKVFHEDLGTIFSLLMVANLQMAFVMFSLCYA